MLLVTQPSPVSLCPSAVCEKWLFGNLIRKTFSRLCWGPPPRLFFVSKATGATHHSTAA